MHFLLFFIRPGMKLHENYTLYAETQQRIQFWVKIGAAIFIVPVASISPFVLVTFHWCKGKYTLDSWFFFYPVW